MIEMVNKQNDLIDIDEDEVIDMIIDNSKEINSCCMTDVIIELNDIIACLQNNPDSLLKNLIKKRDDICEINDLCEACGKEKIFIVNSMAEEYQSQLVGVMRCSDNCEA